GSWRDGRFFDEPDGMQFARDAVARGYLVATIASREAVHGDLNNDGWIGWDTLTTGGEDLRRWDETIRILRGLTTETGKVPFYAVATDAGFNDDAGSMATRLATDHGLSAIAFISSSSRTHLFREMWSASIF